MIIGVDGELRWAVLLAQSTRATTAAEILDAPARVSQPPAASDSTAADPTEAPAPLVERRRRPDRRKDAINRTGVRDRRRSTVVSLESDIAAPPRDRRSEIQNKKR